MIPFEGSRPVADLEFDTARPVVAEPAIDSTGLAAKFVPDRKVRFVGWIGLAGENAEPMTVGDQKCIGKQL